MQFTLSIPLKRHLELGNRLTFCFEVFELIDDSDPAQGGSFQLFQNYDYNEEWNRSIIRDYIDRTLPTSNPTWRKLSRLTDLQYRTTAVTHWDIDVPRKLMRSVLNSSTVDDTLAMTEQRANCLASFEWLGRSFLVHACGPALNEIRVQEIIQPLDPEDMKRTFKTLATHDLLSPVVKIRTSRQSYTSLKQAPMIAVQLSTPEIAIFSVEMVTPLGHQMQSKRQIPRVLLCEHLRFKSHIRNFCWDERPSTVRDTQHLAILTIDGVLSTWQGTDKMRILRSETAAKEVCPPYHFGRPDQTVAGILKVAELGTESIGDDRKPNYGNRLCFSGHPSRLLVMTANSVDLIDFSKSASTQVPLIRFYKSMNDFEVRYARHKGQFENVHRERKEFIEKHFLGGKRIKPKNSRMNVVHNGVRVQIDPKKEKGKEDKESENDSEDDGPRTAPNPVKNKNKRRAEKLKSKFAKKKKSTKASSDTSESNSSESSSDDDVEDEEGFQTTAQLRLEMLEEGREVDTADPIFHFYAPIVDLFDAEYEAMRADGPTFRLTADEILCDIVAHPTRPFLFAILTTMRICLFDERAPEAPLCQWRHHLVKSRRSLYERRIPFSHEFPHTIQFVTVPPALSDLPSLKGKSFIIASSSLTSEVFTIDNGPESTSVDTNYDKMEDIDGDTFENLPTMSEQTRLNEETIAKLTDAIVRDITRPGSSVPLDINPSKRLNFFIPPPMCPRLVGRPQSVFRTQTPLLQEVDYLNSETIKRTLLPERSNIATTALVGLWSYGAAAKKRSDQPARLPALLAIRSDFKGNLFAQIHPFELDAADKEELETMVGENESENESSSSSSEDSAERSKSRSGYSSDSSSESRSESGSDYESSSSKGSLPRPNQEDRDSDTSSSASSSSSSGSSSSSSSESSDDAHPNPQRKLGRFRLGQQPDVKLGLKRLVTLKAPLTEANDEIRAFRENNGSFLANAAYDLTIPAVPYYRFAPTVEKSRMKMILLRGHNYAGLHELTSGCSTIDLILNHAVRQRFNPLTGKLEPPMTALLSKDISDNPEKLDSFLKEYDDDVLTYEPPPPEPEPEPEPVPEQSASPPPNAKIAPTDATAPEAPPNPPRPVPPLGDEFGDFFPQDNDDDEDFDGYNSELDIFFTHRAGRRARKLALLEAEQQKQQEELLQQQQQQEDDYDPNASSMAEEDSMEEYMDEDEDMPKRNKKKRPAPEDREELPFFKRIATHFQTLSPDTLYLCQPQIDYVYAHLAEVLETPVPRRDLPPIDPATTLDVFPTDRSALQRIFDRVKREIFSHSLGVRSTADIFRALVDKALVHPYYFPVAFLRASLCYYVSKGQLEYISQRGLQESTSMYEDAKTNPNKDWASMAAKRHELMQTDALSYFITMYDELDTFAVTLKGTEDVDGLFILGPTKIPLWLPVPSAVEATTPKSVSWRAKRMPYPPPAPTPSAPNEQDVADEIYATQTLQMTQSIPFGSQMTQRATSNLAQSQNRNERAPLTASGVLPFFAPGSSNVAIARAASSLFCPTDMNSQSNAGGSAGSASGGHATMDLDESVAPTQESSLMDHFASQRAFSSQIASSQVLQRVRTQAELDIQGAMASDKATDLETQQSQIMDLLQTQQLQEQEQTEANRILQRARDALQRDMSGDAEEDEEQRLAKKRKQEAKEARTSAEKLNAPGTKRQLMACLLRQWEDAYSDPDHRASADKARQTLHASSRPSYRPPSHH